MSRVERRASGRPAVVRKGMALTVVSFILVVIITIISLFVLPKIIYEKRAGDSLKAGIKYCEDGDLESAERSFEMAVSLRPDNAAAHFDLALVNMAGEGDYISAIKHLKKAVTADPDLARAYHNLGVIQYFLGLTPITPRPG